MRSIRPSALVCLSAVLGACPGGPPDPVPDPGDCWLELGPSQSVDDVKAIGWNTNTLFAGDAAGGVSCWTWSGNWPSGTWQSSSASNDPILWVSSTTYNDTTMPFVWVATASDILRGHCDGGWTSYAQLWDSDLSQVWSGSTLVSIDNHNGVMAFTDGQKVWRSADAGLTWTVVGTQSDLGDTAVSVAVRLSGELVVGTTNDAVWLFDGSVWSQASTGPGVDIGWVGTTGKDKLLAAQGTGPVHLDRSGNNGATWTTPCCSQLQTSPLTSVSVEPAYGPDTDIFVGTDSTGVILSTDDGFNWERFPGSFPVSGLPSPTPRANDLDQDQTARIYMGTDEGVFVENAGGAGNPCLAEGQYGKVADPSADPTGAELLWADGQAAPLACNLDADCCESLGVCDAIASPWVEGLAEHEGAVVGTVTVRHPFGADVAPVEGNVRWTAPPCDNPNGTCPLYLEAVDLSVASLGGGGDAASYWLGGLTLSLVHPTLGAWRPDTSELQIPAEAMTFHVEASESETVPDGGSGRRVLDQRPDGTVTGSATEDRLSLSASRSIQGVEVVVDVYPSDAE